MEELDMDMLSTYARPKCKCIDYMGDDDDKTFAYIETTKHDKTIAYDHEELTDNAWFDSKPPKGLGKEPPPRITARQVQVARIKIEGRKEDDSKDKETVKKAASDANIVSFTKKKAAVEFLSVTSIEDDDD